MASLYNTHILPASGPPPLYNPSNYPTFFKGLKTNQCVDDCQNQFVTDQYQYQNCIIECYGNPGIFAACTSKRNAITAEYNNISGCRNQYKLVLENAKKTCFEAYKQCQQQLGIDCGTTLMNCYKEKESGYYENISGCTGNLQSKISGLNQCIQDLNDSNSEKRSKCGAPIFEGLSYKWYDGHPESEEILEYTDYKYPWAEECELKVGDILDELFSDYFNKLLDINQEYNDKAGDINDSYDECVEPCQQSRTDCENNCDSIGGTTADRNACKSACTTQYSDCTNACAETRDESLEHLQEEREQQDEENEEEFTDKSHSESKKEYDRAIQCYKNRDSAVKSYQDQLTDCYLNTYLAGVDYIYSDKAFRKEINRESATCHQSYINKRQDCGASYTKSILEADFEYNQIEGLPTEANEATRKRKYARALGDYAKCIKSSIADQYSCLAQQSTNLIRTYGIYFDYEIVDLPNTITSIGPEYFLEGEYMNDILGATDTQFPTNGLVPSASIRNDVYLNFSELLPYSAFIPNSNFGSTHISTSQGISNAAANYANDYLNCKKDESNSRSNCVVRYLPTNDLSEPWQDEPDYKICLLRASKAYDSCMFDAQGSLYNSLKTSYSNFVPPTQKNAVNSILSSLNSTKGPSNTYIDVYYNCQEQIARDNTQTGCLKAVNVAAAQRSTSIMKIMAGACSSLGLYDSEESKNIWQSCVEKYNSDLVEMGYSGASGRLTQCFKSQGKYMRNFVNYSSAEGCFAFSLGGGGLQNSPFYSSMGMPKSEPYLNLLGYFLRYLSHPSYTEGYLTYSNYG